MPRKWTREERKKHIREKYVPWRYQIFTVVIAISVVVIGLYLTIVGFSSSVPLQITSGLLIAVTLLLLLLSIWGGVDLKSRIGIFLLTVIILIVLLGVWLIELSAFQQLIASVIIGIILLVLIAVAVLFVDMVTYELE